MELVNCYIENFGKFHKEYREFKNGLNTIKEDNGYGKTTLCAFIKAMFYGFDTRNKRGITNERKRFEPWQGGNYGGNLTFKIENKEYKIERFFGKKESEDTFKLYDVKTKLESNDYDKNIGEEIFKINKEGYERSTYIPQGEIQVEMEDSINSKLGNVLEGSDINTSDIAINKINSLKKVYKKDKGSTGLIDKKEDELQTLIVAKENLNKDEENLQIINEKLKELKDKRLTIEKENEINKAKKEELEEKEKLEAKKETYKNLIKNYEANQKKVDDINKFFNNEVLSDDEIDNIEVENRDLSNVKLRLNNISNEIEENKNKINVLRNRYENKDISDEKINQILNEYSKISTLDSSIMEKKNIEKNIKNSLRVKEIFSSIIIVLGIALLVFEMLNNMNIIIGAVLAIAGIVLLIIFLSNRKIQNISDEIEKIEKEKEEKNNLINAFINEFYSPEENIDIGYNYDQNKEAVDGKIDSVSDNNSPIVKLGKIQKGFNQFSEIQIKEQEKTKEKEKLIVERDNLSEKINNILNKYNFDDTNEENNLQINNNKTIDDKIKIIMINKNNYELSIKDLNTAKIDKENFEKENDISKLKILENEENNQIENIQANLNEEKNELNDKIKQNEAEIDSIKDSEKQLENRAETIENNLDELDNIQMKIDNLSEEIEKLKEKYKILDDTEKLLKEAKEKFSSSYLDDMVENYNTYIKLLDDGNLASNVDVKLNVKVDVDGKEKDYNAFSKGMQDLIYLCIRFSLIKTMFKDEKPFVILDDPFVNLDDKKTKKALSLIEKLSNEYQIIYLVCNSSRI